MSFPIVNSLAAPKDWGLGRVLNDLNATLASDGSLTLSGNIHNGAVADNLHMRIYVESLDANGTMVFSDFVWEGDCPAKGLPWNQETHRIIDVHRSTGLQVVVMQAQVVSIRFRFEGP